MATRVAYRDSRLRRVTIDISDLIEAQEEHAPGLSFGSYTPVGHTKITFNAIDEPTADGIPALYTLTLILDDFVYNYWSPELKKETIAEELESLAKWLVINGSYQEYGTQGKQVLRIDRKGAETISYRVDPNGRFRLIHFPLIDLPVRESQIARRAIFTELYLGRELRRDDITNRAHMPLKVASTELTGLRASKFLTEVHGAADLILLTTEGREYYENTLRKRSGIAFIIAACHADDLAKEDDHLKALAAYREVLQQAYTPIFQENEEPWKNIYTDIFDYLDTSEIVVADLTWERPNCYVEIGYALAQRIPTLLFVEERYFVDEMDKKLPFDLFPLRVLTYGSDTDLRMKLEKRVQIWKDRRAT